MNKKRLEDALIAAKAIQAGILLFLFLKFKVCW
jgi:hypothetical protein